MVTEHKSGDSSSRLKKQWILATTVSAAIATAGLTYLVIQFEFYFYYPTILEYVGTLLFIIIIFGVLPGTIQWFVLRLYFQQAGLWILATTGGLSISLFPAYFVFQLLDFMNERNVSPVITIGLLIILGVMVLGFYAVVTSALQRHVFQKQYPESRTWLSVSLRAWGIGIGIGLVVSIVLFIGTTVVMLADAFIFTSDLAYHVGVETIYILVSALLGSFIGAIAAMLSVGELVKFVKIDPSEKSGIKSEPVMDID